MAFKTDRLIQGDRLIQYRLIQVQVVTSDGKYNTSTEKRAIAALQCHSVNVMEKVTSPTSIY